MKVFNLFLMLSLITLFACNSERKEIKETPKLKVEKQVEEVKYERLPAEYVSSILQNADALEATFYESGKSVSLWDDNVKNVFAMMIGVPPVSLNSKLVGHIMYLKQGESLAYVEVFLSPENNYVKYKLNGEVYYNKINEKGKQFLIPLATATEIQKAD